jgi:hypothetical protein
MVVKLKLKSQTCSSKARERMNFLLKKEAYNEKCFQAFQSTFKNSQLMLLTLEGPHLFSLSIKTHSLSTQNFASVDVSND